MLVVGADYRRYEAVEVLVAAASPSSPVPAGLSVGRVAIAVKDRVRTVAWKRNVAIALSTAPAIRSAIGG